MPRNLPALLFRILLARYHHQQGPKGLIGIRSVDFAQREWEHVHGYTSYRATNQDAGKVLRACQGTEERDAKLHFCHYFSDPVMEAF